MEEQTAYVYVLHNCEKAEQQISDLETENEALRDALRAYQQLANRIEYAVRGLPDGSLAVNVEWQRERSQLCSKTDALLAQGRTENDDVEWGNISRMKGGN